MSVSWETLSEVAGRVYERHEGQWPWRVVGVFPTEDTEGDHGAWWNSFCYTAGLDLDLWAPICSIEGRCADWELTCSVLNVIGAGLLEGMLDIGDDVRVPLGIPDQHGEWDRDEDSVWWIGLPEWNDRRQANLGGRRLILPVLWSSPLGWGDE